MISGILERIIPFRDWIYLVLLIAIVLMFAWYRNHLINIGHDQCMAAVTAEHAKAVQATIDEYNKISAQDALIIQPHAQIRASAARIDAKTTAEVASHVEKNPTLYSQRLDACGLCLKHSAITGTDPADCPCGSHDQVPAH